MNSYAIKVESLRKSFGNQLVLDSINLTVPKGTVYALLGPNGAGKTTLINILSTLIAPDGGSASVAGYDVQTAREDVKRSISLTGQHASVDEVLTAEENLRMMGRLSGLSSTQSRARASELLHQFDLAASANKRVKTYSGGMRRRLDLALSLVVPRPILFLDEPTTGLDTMSRRELWKMILNLKNHGTTVLLTTQYLEEADHLADQIAVIARGQVVATGTAKELKERIGGEVLELRDENDEVFQQLPSGGTVTDIRNLLDQLTDVVPKHTRITIRRPSLDDVFLALTGTEGVKP